VNNKKKNTVFCVIASYNGSRWYERCLGSLQQSEINVQTVVVDNASSDGTAEFMQKKFPEMKFFPQTENLGFGKANNIGIKYALEKDADYVFLLNQDAWIEPDTIQKLLEVFEQNSEAGIVAPLQLNGKGEGIDLKFLDTYLSHGNTPFYIDDLYFNRTKTCYEAKLVNFAACLISRKCIERVGGLDTSLFYHYGEDWNYCQRVQYHGFKIFIAPKTIAFHDREERNGKFAKGFENAWGKIAPVLRFANILSSENDFDNFLAQARKKYERTMIKFALRLKIKQIFLLKKKRSEEIQLFEKIKISREINKKGGLVWL
jgi:GT2 family glycosyltransferase